MTTRVLEFIDELREQRGDWIKLLMLIIVSFVCAIVVVDYNPTPTEELRVGDVAPRTVKAPFTFAIQDFAGYEERREQARQAVLPVFSTQLDLADQLETRITTAFGQARDEVRETTPPVVEGDGEPEEVVLDHEAIADVFRTALGIELPTGDISVLIEAGFPDDVEQMSIGLIRDAMAEPIAADRSILPIDGRHIRVIALKADGTREERIITDPTTIHTPAEARQKVSIAHLELGRTDPAHDVAARIARALVRPNLAYEHLETEERRSQAAASVPIQTESVKRGAILFREGDTLTDVDLIKYKALQDYKYGHPVWLEIGAIALFLLLVMGSLYHFGATYISSFSRRLRDAMAAGVLLVVVAVLARGLVLGSEGLAGMIGFDAVAMSVWFVVPVAGAAMLVRLLVGVSWTLVYAIAASVVCGLVMELRAEYLVYFLLSSVAAAGAVEHTRERIAVLRAGLFTGLVNAAAVLLIHFLQLFFSESEISMATTMRPVWSMSFAFSGGVASAFLVLGLMPLFESVGFVTDYRLMELANLNHPLLRNLMLRAPGSYHHSVLVGTLAEAACEAIGANALQAKVSAYFHDIGKSVKPTYFVENQRDGLNKHNQLDPYTSAQIIINHVIDGGKMAEEHRLPKPLIDNIYMHHGDGLLMYFFAKAKEEDPDVDEAAFRYPGPKPDTREAGVIMLADKVEAATRTIKQPNEENIRAMINRIISSVIADGQFDNCPLTFEEIRITADTFLTVLLGIYHQRIEYPQTQALSRATEDEPAAEEAKEANAGVITLELPNTRRRTGDADYEALEHLPGLKGTTGSDS